MTFLDVIEVPEHDKTIFKNEVCVCMCVCVCVSVCLSSRLLYFFTILQRSRWCQNLHNFNAMNWFVFEISRVTVSWRAWQKRHFFKLFLKKFNFLTFLWIVEHISIVAHVNAHLVMYHTYRVSTPMTR
jgi:hypothetical protein